MPARDEQDEAGQANRAEEPAEQVRLGGEQKWAEHDARRPHDPRDDGRGARCDRKTQGESLLVAIRGRLDELAADVGGENGEQSNACRKSESRNLDCLSAADGCADGDGKGQWSDHASDGQRTHRGDRQRKHHSAPRRPTADGSGPAHDVTPAGNSALQGCSAEHGDNNPRDARYPCCTARAQRGYVHRSHVHMLPGTEGSHDSCRQIIFTVSRIRL